MQFSMKRKAYEMDKNPIYKKREDCKDQDEYETQFRSEMFAEMENFSYDTMIGFMGQTVKSRFDIDRQKMCRGKCKRCDDVKKVDINQRA